MFRDRRGAIAISRAQSCFDRGHVREIGGFPSKSGHFLTLRSESPSVLAKSTLLTTCGLLALSLADG